MKDIPQIKNIVKDSMNSVREKVREELWNLGDEFFNEILSELMVTISSYSTEGGMVINVRSCEDHELDRSFNMSEILERSLEYEDGDTSYHGQDPDLEILAQSFESLAKKCRDRLKEIGTKQYP